MHIKILEREHCLWTSYRYFLDRPAIKIRLSLRNNVLMHIPSIPLAHILLIFFFAGEGCYSTYHFKIFSIFIQIWQILAGRERLNLLIWKTQVWLWDVTSERKVLRPHSIRKSLSGIHPWVHIYLLLYFQDTCCQTSSWTQGVRNPGSSAWSQYCPVGFKQM